MSLSNDGKSSEAIFEAYWASKGKKAWLERRFDAAHIRGLNPGKRLVVPAQPSDYMLTYEGRTSYCEVKSVTGTAPYFPKSALTVQQRAAARRVIAAGGAYVVFIHRRALNQWFILSGSQIADEQKSVPYNEMTEFPFV